MVLSSEDECVRITVTKSDLTVDPYSELLSCQDQGDTNVILHAAKILHDSGAVVTFSSPSRDSDILIIKLGLLQKRRASTPG